MDLKKHAISILSLIFMIVILRDEDIASEYDNHKNQHPDQVIAAFQASSFERESLKDSRLVLPKTFIVWVTAYSSASDQTDDTSFITARGTRAHEGVVAANFLPFGAKIMIPEFFGERVFCVEDRMHKRHKNFIDIWMSSKKEAKMFGIRRAKIVIVE